MTGERRPTWRIEDVLDRTDLAGLLDDVAEPATHTARGRRWHCPLPQHDDHHASVTMHTDHRGHERWRCWSGDDTHRGDAIDLAIATQHLSRGEAIDWLARRAGMIPDHAADAPPRKITRSAPAIVPLDPAVIRYAEACQRILWTPTGQPVRAWLHARGFTDELLHANHVGADPGRAMMRRRPGLPHGTSIAAVFPALDPSGNIRYLQARYLEPGGGPKYDNPAASLGTNPRLAWTRHVGGRRNDVLIICEGIPDALTAAQAGFDAVAVLGSQAPDQSVAARLVAVAGQREMQLIAVVDNDPAGHAWGDRLRALLRDHGYDLSLFEPPEAGLDLNAWALQSSEWTHSMASTACADGFDRQSLDMVGVEVMTERE